MNLKLVSRKKVHKSLTDKDISIIKNVVLLTYVQVVDKDKIEVEFCENRCVDKRIFLGRYTLPHYNLDGNYSLLFNRLIFSPKLFLQTFRELSFTLEILNQLLEKGPQHYMGEPYVYPYFRTVKKMFRPEYGELFTPKIIALEYTEKELCKYFKGIDAEEKIQNELLSENHLLTDGWEALRDGKTGERIFRFTKMEFLEENPQDRIISYKLSESDYDKIKSGKDYLPWDW